LKGLGRRVGLLQVWREQFGWLAGVQCRVGRDWDWGKIPEFWECSWQLCLPEYPMALVSLPWMAQLPAAS
jgi:hypothetical protein